MSTIQISYEDNLVPLTTAVEDRIRGNVSVVLNKTGNQDKGLSLFFCHPETIQNLNLTYREVDKPTDILSWSYDEEEPVPGTESLLGELVICMDICERQADDTGWDLESELLRLVVHGIGHLMGFDHEQSETEEKKALEFEEELLASINLKDVYG